MSKTKHTPGPWKRCGGSTPYYSAIHSARGYIVFQMADYHHHTEHEKPIESPGSDEQRANANLIAAAPELFESQTAETWLVWSCEHDAWWRANDHGYTPYIEKAGRYSLERAMEICCMKPSGQYPSLRDEIPVPSPEWIAARRSALAKSLGEQT